MINLKKLEEKLDKVLSKETRESLSKWLSEQRNKFNDKKVKLYFKLHIDKLAAIIFFTCMAVIIIYFL